MNVKFLKIPRQIKILQNWDQILNLAQDLDHNQVKSRKRQKVKKNSNIKIYVILQKNKNLKNKTKIKYKNNNQKRKLNEKFYINY